MKITVTNDKLVAFADVAEGTVFKDPTSKDGYYIKGRSTLADDGCNELNCFCLTTNEFDCFGEGYMVKPIYKAELIIP